MSLKYMMTSLPWARYWAAFCYDLLVALGLAWLAVACYWGILSLTHQPYHKAVAQLTCLIFLSAYYLRCWTISGQTLGDRSWKIQLLQTNGQRLTWRLAVARLCLWVLFSACGGMNWWWPQPGLLCDRCLRLHWTMAR